MVSIETQRLIIRNFTAQDWEPLRDIIVQYEVSPYAIYDREWPASEDELRKIVERSASRDALVAVCLRESGQMIGFIALDRTSAEGEFELGYTFNFDYRGKGYASESCRAIVDHAFSALGAKKLIAGTGAENDPSIRLLARLGMRKTGQQVTSFRNTADGRPIEFMGVMFQLDREDWLKGKDQA